MEVSDRYVVSGEDYKTVREALTKVILGEDIKHLQEKLQVNSLILFQMKAFFKKCLRKNRFLG